MTTTTLTNASLADAVALFLSDDPDASSVPTARPFARRALNASQPVRPVVVPLFQSRDPAFEEESTSAFDLLGRGTG